MNENMDSKTAAEINEEAAKIQVPKGKRSYLFDILAAGLWIVIMWGFLGLLSVTDSPKDQAGLHELLAYTYFFGFTLVYGLFYVLAFKKGV